MVFNIISQTIQVGSISVIDAYDKHSYFYIEMGTTELIFNSNTHNEITLVKL